MLYDFTKYYNRALLAESSTSTQLLHFISAIEPPVKFQNVWKS